MPVDNRHVKTPASVLPAAADVRVRLLAQHDLAENRFLPLLDDANPRSSNRRLLLKRNTTADRRFKRIPRRWRFADALLTELRLLDQRDCTRFCTSVSKTPNVLSWRWIVMLKAWSIRLAV